MSFAQAAETHLDDVFGYLAWFTGDRFVAEDLTGETFDHFRSERRRVRREELAALPERIEERVAEGLSPELERGMLRLSAGEREVIALRVVLDLDAGAAARVLGISPTNCTTRLNRALKKLEEAVHVAA